MRTLSWILLMIVSVLVALVSISSVAISYFAPESSDLIVGPTSLKDLNLSDEVSKAFRGRRATAAAYALGFASFMLFVVLGPYRKGSVWAWWAILVSTVLLSSILVLRIPTLGISQGATTGIFLLVTIVIALLMDVRRLFSTVAPK